MNINSDNYQVFYKIKYKENNQYKVLFNSIEDIPTDYPNTVCFSRFFKNVIFADNKPYTIKGDIKFYHTTKYVNKFRLNSYCFLNIKDIKLWMRLLQSYINFSYSIKKFDEYYVISFRSEDTHFKHKLLLTWIRGLFEVPYSYITYDVINLYKNKIFKGYSIFEIYSIVSRSYSFGGGHSFLHNNMLFDKFTKNNIISFLNRKYSYRENVNDKIRDIFRINKEINGVLFPVYNYAYNIDGDGNIDIIKEDFVNKIKKYKEFNKYLIELRKA